jgi:hypothetical protein
MKLFIFIVLSVMLVATTALAGEVPTSRGDKAMVFMFNGFDDLSVGGYGPPAEDFDEYGFGMRYYISDGTALRVGFQFGRSSFTDEDAADDWETIDSVYGVNAIYEMHMAGPCSSVSPYWGFGGAYSMFSDKYNQNAPDPVIKRTISGSGFAGFGVMGFEWGFTDCLTLGGEYLAGFGNWSGKTETDVGGDVTTSNEYSSSLMGFGTASVYLSVYW